MAQTTGPSVGFFDTEAVAPGANTDVEVKVSINGRLIVVKRGGDDEKGAFYDERYGLNWSEFDNLVGRLLTLADATFTDPIQRKAFKDLLRQHVKEWVTDCIMDAASDAGIQRPITVPFVGGVLDQPGGLFGVEGEPTP